MEPRMITTIREALEGSPDMGLADISSSTLEKARTWGIHNDGALLVDIEDELNFRANA